MRKAKKAKTPKTQSKKREIGLYNMKRENAETRNNLNRPQLIYDVLFERRRIWSATRK